MREHSTDEKIQRDIIIAQQKKIAAEKAAKLAKKQGGKQ